MYAGPLVPWRETPEQTKAQASKTTRLSVYLPVYIMFIPYQRTVDQNVGVSRHPPCPD